MFYVADLIVLVLACASSTMRRVYYGLLSLSKVTSGSSHSPASFPGGLHRISLSFPSGTSGDYTPLDSLVKSRDQAFSAHSQVSLAKVADCFASATRETRRTEIRPHVHVNSVLNSHIMSNVIEIPTRLLAWPQGYRCLFPSAALSDLGARSRVDVDVDSKYQISFAVYLIFTWIIRRSRVNEGILRIFAYHVKYALCYPLRSIIWVNSVTAMIDVCIIQIVYIM